MVAVIRRHYKAVLTDWSGFFGLGNSTKRQYNVKSARSQSWWSCCTHTRSQSIVRAFLSTSADIQRINNRLARSRAGPRPFGGTLRRTVCVCVETLAASIPVHIDLSDKWRAVAELPAAGNLTVAIRRDGNRVQCWRPALGN